jgi:hypothetical protein
MEILMQGTYCPELLIYDLERTIINPASEKATQEEPINAKTINRADLLTGSTL